MDPPGAALAVDYVYMEREIQRESRVQRSPEAETVVSRSAAAHHGSNSELQTEQEDGRKPPPSSLPRFKDQAMGSSVRSIIPDEVVPEEAPVLDVFAPRSSVATRNTPGLPRFKDQAMGREISFQQHHVASAVAMVPTTVHTNAHKHRQISGLSGPTFKDQTRESAMPPIVSSRHIQTEGPQQQTISRDAFIALQNEGFPSGLIQQLDTLKQVYASRYWIVDNSGSMLKPDCQRLVKSSQIVAGCSRWDELCRTVQAHAVLAARIQAPTYFRWLNDPGARLGPAEVCVQNDEDVQVLMRTMEAIQPGGRTPLTQHIQQLESRIRNANYGATGQKAVVVIATDGLPTNEQGDSSDESKHEFVHALRLLGSLPVWIVVRLCTNDDNVIQYYRKLDGQLEFEIEVIDDFVNEAKQVERFNGWLGYGHPLHLCREMGFHVRLFDLFNERSFTLDEIEELAKLLYGNTQITHSVHQNYKEFCSDVNNSIAPPSFCPVKLKKRPWIDVRKLKREGSIFGMIRERMNSALSIGPSVASGIGR